MPYYNISDASIDHAENYISQNWVKPKDANCLKKHVAARGASFLLVPSSIVTGTLDIITGLGAGIVALGSLGLHKPTVCFAKDHLSSANLFIVRPFVHLMKTINPKAKFTTKKDGFIANAVKESLRDLASQCYNSDNFLQRHVASRLTYALLAISCVITRVVDAIIGVCAAAVALLTLGMIKEVNNLAYQGLQAPGIITDLFYCTLKIINPWAGK